MKTFLRWLLTIAFLAALSGSRAMACAACFNSNAGSKMGDAATWGVAAMVVIMFVMLGAIVAAGFYLNYRAKHPFPDYEELLKDEEPLPDAS